MCIAAAIAGAAVAGLAGSAIAGSDAAGATTSAANTAANEQYAALAQEKQLAAPYTALGQSAIPEYQALLGIGPKGQEGVQETLQNMPGYKFAQQQGTQQTNNALSAQGLSLSGNQAQGLSQFNTGLAQQNYQSYLGDLLAPIQIGQGASAGQAANIQTGASNLGNIAVNQGNNIANIETNEIAGLTSAAGNASNQYITQQTLQNLYGGASGAGSSIGGPGGGTGLLTGGSYGQGP
jgi:hypothetical protein